MATTKHDRILQISYDLQDKGAVHEARSIALLLDERDALLLALQRMLIEMEYVQEKWPLLSRRYTRKYAVDEALRVIREVQRHDE